MVRPRVRTRRAIVVALITGAALLALAVAVFSVVAEARSVAAQSAELQASDEALRSAVVIRSQLATAANFAALDVELGVAGTAIVDTAADDATLGLRDLDASVVALADEGAAVPPATAASLDRFRLAADDVLRLIETGQGVEARDAAIADLVPAFDDVTDRLLALRGDIADELQSTDRRLSRLGDISSFVIAFLVPTIAAFIYHQITRRHRETVAAAHALDDERVLAGWRAVLVERAMAAVSADVDASPESEPRRTAPRVRRTVATTSFLVSATQSGYRYRPSPGDVDELLRDVAPADPTIELAVHSSGEVAINVDRSVFVLMVENLVDAAGDRGATRIDLTVLGEGSDAVRLRLADNGRPLDAAAVARVLHRPMLLELAEGDLQSSGLALLTARFIAEVHHGRVEATVDGDGAPAIDVIVPTTEVDGPEPAPPRQPLVAAP